MLWYGACCPEHTSRLSRPLPSSGMTGGAAAALPTDFQGSSETFCRRLVRETHSRPRLPPTGSPIPSRVIWSLFFFLVCPFFASSTYSIIKITCEEEWTLGNLRGQTVDLASGDETVACRTKCSVNRPIDKTSSESYHVHVALILVTNVNVHSNS